VCLADARGATEEEGVVRLRRQLGDRQRGRMGEAVGAADHELLEAVGRVEDPWPPFRLGRGGGRLGHGLGSPLVHDLDGAQDRGEVRGGGREAAAEATADPVPRLHGRLDVEHAAVERDGAEGLEPHAVDVVGDVAPKALGERVPGLVEFRIGGQGLLTAEQSSAPS
jgi:hypothetical protein